MKKQNVLVHKNIVSAQIRQEAKINALLYG